MLYLHVTNRIAPGHAAEFLAAARDNADHAMRDEPGCLRFDVVRDLDDPLCFYFHEVYQDDAALQAHRQSPHFKTYMHSVQPWLAAPTERRFGQNVVPADADWR